MRAFIRFLGVLLLMLGGGLTKHARQRSRPHRNRKHRYDDD